MIRTPDQRLRVFISSTLKELQQERNAAREAVSKLRLTPVLFEQGARPYPPRTLYRSYLDQSHVFVGIYWQQYGWVAPDMEISGLEDEYGLAADKPRLIYIREPAPGRDPRLTQLLDRIREAGGTSYKRFQSASELGTLIEEDLALLLSERFGGAHQDAIPSIGIARPRSRGVPVPATPFIGREREIRTLRGLLDQHETRLVTLKGPGGVGKSRLALRLAGVLKERFEDGMAVVLLDNVPMAEMVAPAIVGALGLLETPGQTALEVLEDYLHKREMLLVLDGFEHVVGAAPTVAALLEKCERVKILVTSREVLRLSGEHVFDVPPLPVPEAPGLGVETIRKSDAVRLFLDRARAVKEDFKLDDRNAPAIAEIVRRLEGLPLAIELAAARIRVFPPEAILQRLESRLGLLTGGPRDLPERQQTLRNTIDWSHGMLAEGDKVLLARLSVFVGGWALETAEAVCAPEKDMDVVEALSSLIDKSLVRTEGFAGNEPRFSMLEIVREYALERLTERGEVGLRNDLHADSFLALAERGAPGSVSREQSLERLMAESGNIRAAMGWLMKTSPSRAAHFGWALWNCWWLRAQLSEAVSWMERILGAPEPLSPAERAKATFVLGVSSYGLGHPDLAVTHLQTALTLFRNLGDQHGATTALASLGAAVAQAVDPAQGEGMLREAMITFRELKDPWGASQVVFGLAWVLSVQDRGAEAVPFLEESVKWARGSGERLILIISLTNLGWAYLGAGNRDLARAALLESLKLAEDLSNLPGGAYTFAMGFIAWLFEAFATLAVGADDPSNGAVLFGAAESVRRSLGAEMWAPQLLRRERTRQALRKALGEDRFEAKFAEGTRMSPQDALKLVAAL